MAGGWSRDGAVQDQIDDSVQDAVQLARSLIPRGESPDRCVDCDDNIPLRRREAIPGVRTCINCQTRHDTSIRHSAINRRGSKDSQLR
jgi:RNA polymerase-binding transcription factor DksA